jgi:hypothetical protein
MIAKISLPCMTPGAFGEVEMLLQVLKVEGEVEMEVEVKAKVAEVAVGVIALCLVKDGEEDLNRRLITIQTVL